MLLLRKYLKTPAASDALLVADIVIMVITAYLLYAGIRALLRHFRLGAAGQAAEAKSAQTVR